MQIATEINVPISQSVQIEERQEQGHLQPDALGTENLEVHHQFSGAHLEVKNPCQTTCYNDTKNHAKGTTTDFYASRREVGTQTSISVETSAPPKESSAQDWNGATVIWRDLTVTIKGKRKYSEKVVSTSTGYALPGTVTGLMGPPRSGKSTLMRALSDILPKRAKVYGEILINGSKGQLKYGSFAYITKYDHLVETLTVQEALQYSCLFQLPDHVPPPKKHAAVDEIMKIMELNDVANFRIGGQYRMKGLSIGERRRLSIAMELLTKPSLVFIDEPIDCLDSVSALMMMVTLKRLSQTGCTVVITIQNSSTEVFGLLGRICLIANGKTVFFGETRACLEHFSDAGFPCPLLQNPSDYIIRAINHDFDKILKLGRNRQEFEAAFPEINTDLIIQTLETVYKSSHYAAAMESLVTQLSQKEGPSLPVKQDSTFLTQLVVLAKRSYLNMLRDWQYFWLRFCLSILLMVCLGTTYLGFKQSFSIQEQVSAFFYIISFVCLLGIGGFPALIKELEVSALITY